MGCCYPLQAHPTRENIKTIVKAFASEGLNEDTAHYTITTVFVIITGAIACTVDDLGLVLSVVGATGSTIVSYILPGGCYFLLFPDRSSRALGAIILGMGCFIMPMSLYLIFFGK